MLLEQDTTRKKRDIEKYRSELYLIGTILLGAFLTVIMTFFNRKTSQIHTDFDTNMLLILLAVGICFLGAVSIFVVFLSKNHEKIKNEKNQFFIQKLDNIVTKDDKKEIDALGRMKLNLEAIHDFYWWSHK